MNRRLRAIPFIIILFTAVVSLTAQSGREKIAPDLWQSALPGKNAECIISFWATADLSDLAGIHGKVRKGEIVYQRLKATAAGSQRQVRNLLEGSAHPYRSFLIVNAIYTRADRNLLLRIAQMPEVKSIQANTWMPIVEWQPAPQTTTTGRSPVEWGVALINVPEVWAQGINGSGVVIGNQDTGVEWVHPTLKEKYRAWENNEKTIDHNYHWFDAITEISPLHNDPSPDPGNNPCGLSVDFPCDDNDHGTYTLGISVGDDGQGNQIGVAPGSQWIACRNMERGYGSPATYLTGFEWFLAPTDLNGHHPRPDLAPHVINNSWGCPVMEGCTIENWGILETAVENLRAAGVVVVVSAGNDGPECGSVNDPAAIFPGSFSVGATNFLDTLAKFSSRGPVTVDGSGRLKPDVVAPGVFVRSARRNNDFMAASGTSAAAPFVAGAVALIIQANPELAGEVALIEQILRETTVPAFDTVSCGGYTAADIPNPMMGYGRIDVLAAVERAREVSLAGGTADTFPVSVYPNPSRGEVFFTTTAGLSGSRIRIFDATGRLISERNDNTLPVVIDLSAQASGLYWWRWDAGGRAAEGKVIRH